MIGQASKRWHGKNLGDGIAYSSRGVEYAVRQLVGNTVSHFVNGSHGFNKKAVGFSHPEPPPSATAADAPAPQVCFCAKHGFQAPEHLLLDEVPEDEEEAAGGSEEGGFDADESPPVTIARRHWAAECIYRSAKLQCLMASRPRRPTRTV